MRDDEDLPPELPRSSDGAVVSYQKHVEENVARQKASGARAAGAILPGTAELLLRRSEELSRYIDDLHAAYDELE